MFIKALKNLGFNDFVEYVIWSDEFVEFVNLDDFVKFDSFCDLFALSKGNKQMRRA